MMKVGALAGWMMVGAACGGELVDEPGHAPAPSDTSGPSGPTVPDPQGGAFVAHDVPKSLSAESTAIDPSTSQDASPKTKAFFNVDFGPQLPAKSEQVGPAALGGQGDRWNAVSVAWVDDHVEKQLVDAAGKASPIEVRLQNLGGSWGLSHRLAIHDTMLDSFAYPQNNQGGDAYVTLAHVPAGTYALYLYGTSANPDYFGDYAVSVGEQVLGRKRTTTGPEAAQADHYTEGLHYVRFDHVVVRDGDDLWIRIRPGNVVSDSSGRTFSDAYISGLQLARE